jgi:[glutamine synthetase] adenylyltransferase / [glutamine synthetase]-adenylyl-L-tyrosine phosphorylase
MLKARGGGALSESGSPRKSRLEGAIAAAVARTEFLDRQGASEILGRIAAQVPAGTAEALITLLPDLPDPDGGLASFERLLESGGRELERLLDRHRFLIHYALVVFGYSRFLGDTLIRNPELLHTFLKERVLDRSYAPDELHEAFARFRARSGGPGLMAAGASSGQGGASATEEMSVVLARFKRREYVRIMLRDVLGIAPLAETTAEISALADVLIEEALSEAEVAMRRRYGSPQHLDAEGRVVQTPFAVLSLGKLGGNELNYSSDVDLLYVYGDGEEQPAVAISNREYFVRQAQLLTQILSRMTAEGRVFRIDLRLRPQGGEGEPAIALSQALRYYALTAHDWERQALIKVRHSAGSASLAREFIRGVQPYIYSPHINFAAIETALDTRERISARRRQALLESNRVDVKLDRGGIRDIEFLVQCLQRVYGGAEPWLRSGGTLFSLQKLHDKRHITGNEFHELTTAYEFLRKVEHRLQLRQGQQTHRLPDLPEQLRIVQLAVGADKTLQYAPGGIAARVRERMAAVAEIYERIIHHQQLQALGEEDEFRLVPRVEQSGAEQPYHQLLQRVGEDSPLLHEIAVRPELDAVTRRNLYRFLSAAFTSSERYAAVLRAPQAVERALELFGGSDYLTDILLRHPEEIASLNAAAPKLGEGTGQLFAQPDGRDSGLRGDPEFEYLRGAYVSYGEKLALLRRHYRHRVFASGAADILELRPVYESLRQTSVAADNALRAAFAIAGEPQGLAVLALGRLGTFEFDLLSDADVLFVREEGLPAEAAARSAGLIMQTLAAYTREGTVFPVDARLRPRGSEGELVVTAAELHSYCAQEAQAWEALTFTKLRPVVGSATAAAQAQEAARELSRRFAGDSAFLLAVREMRLRLEHTEPAAGNFKTSPGAVYDIDFLACYLAIRHQIAGPCGNLRERLCCLRERKLLEESDWANLDGAAELFRTVEHAVRLVVGKARKSLPATEHGRCAAERLTALLLGRELVGGLEAELARTMAEVRSIYERVVR